MTYPKILELREDQPHKEKWEKYFLAMYLDECKRLALSPVSPPLYTGTSGNGVLGL